MYRWFATKIPFVRKEQIQTKHRLVVTNITRGRLFLRKRPQMTLNPIRGVAAALVSLMVL